MDRKPLVSIITPSFNQGQFIEDNVLSIVYQDYPYIEHIVVDGGSTDSTVRVLTKYTGTVKWISEPDKGFADAVNKGIRMSSGELLAIQNSDDSYHNHTAVSKAVNAFTDNPRAGVVFGDSAIIDENNRILRSQKGSHKGFNFTALVCSEFIIPQASAFIRRSALETIGGYLDKNIDWCADFDLWLRIGLRYPILYIPEVIADYRIHPEHRNADPAYAKRNPTHRRLALDKLFSLPDLPSGIRSLKNHAYAGTYGNQAIRLANFGCTKEMLTSIITAIGLYPPYLLDWKLYKQITYSIFKWALTENQFEILKRLKKYIQGRGKDVGKELQYNKWWEHYKE